VVEWFVIRGSRVQISARRPAILTEVSRGLPQSLQAIPGYYLKLGHDRLLSFEVI
jgi:hypothetical protein